jgi:putative nucleotidyltransferase with HDIG domain
VFYSNEGMGMKKNRISLKTFIYKTLIKRLAISTLLIASLFAFASFYHSKEMINRAVRQLSKVQISFIKSRVQEAIAARGGDLETALAFAVNFPPVKALQIREGEFVYLMLHDERREHVAVYQHEGVRNDNAVQRHIITEIAKHSGDAYRGPEYNWLKIDGRTYLEIHESLLKENDGSAIYLRALFVLSDLTVESIRAFTIRNTLSILAAIIATAMLLYPVVTILFNRITQFSFDLLTAHLQTMEALGETISKRDSDTSLHNYRVTILTVSIALQINIAHDKMKSLIKGAFLHDIGKIGVRDNILLSHERYNEKERQIMQEHVPLGLDIINRSSWLKDAAAIVGNHHEKYDGSGYPGGLKGTDIPLEARIFTIADVFDALTSKRSYKEPYSYEEAMAYMHEGRGVHFDPIILDAFIQISRQLYYTYATLDDNTLKNKFKEITDLYFHQDIEAMIN